MPVNRRGFLKSAILLPGLSSTILGSAENLLKNPGNIRRVRPSDPAWPSPQKWEALSNQVNGNLIKIESPFTTCNNGTNNAACEEIFKNLKNPYFIGDNPALT